MDCERLEVVAGTKCSPPLCGFKQQINRFAGMLFMIRTFEDAPAVFVMPCFCFDVFVVSSVTHCYDVMAYTNNPRLLWWSLNKPFASNTYLLI